jgi:hypothetical protein
VVEWPMKARTYWRGGARSGPAAECLSRPPRIRSLLWLCVRARLALTRFHEHGGVALGRGAPQKSAGGLLGPWHHTRGRSRRLDGGLRRERTAVFLGANDAT